MRFGHVEEKRQAASGKRKSAGKGWEQGASWSPAASRRRVWLGEGIPTEEAGEEGLAGREPTCGTCGRPRGGGPRAPSRRWAEQGSTLGSAAQN